MSARTTHNPYQPSSISVQAWLRREEETPLPPPRPVALEELAQHDSPSSLWMAVHGRVYDVTSFLAVHPGGRASLLRGGGLDATALFVAAHPYLAACTLLAKCFVGELQLTPPPGTGAARGVDWPADALLAWRSGTVAAVAGGVVHVDVGGGTAEGVVVVGGVLELCLAGGVGAAGERGCGCGAQPPHAHRRALCVSGEGTARHLRVVLLDDSGGGGSSGALAEGAHVVVRGPAPPRVPVGVLGGGAGEGARRGAALGPSAPPLGSAAAALLAGGAFVAWADGASGAWRGAWPGGVSELGAGGGVLCIARGGGGLAACLPLLAAAAAAGRGSSSSSSTSAISSGTLPTALLWDVRCGAGDALALATGLSDEAPPFWDELLRVAAAAGGARLSAAVLVAEGDLEASEGGVLAPQWLDAPLPPHVVLQPASNDARVEPQLLARLSRAGGGRGGGGAAPRSLLPPPHANLVVLVASGGDDEWERGVDAALRAAFYLAPQCVRVPCERVG